MSARDELAAVIDAADDAWDKVVAPSAEWAQDVADAILAAGYTKPRTITTVEELDELLADNDRGVTLLDSGGFVWWSEYTSACGNLLTGCAQARRPGETGQTLEFWGNAMLPSEAIAYGPFTLIHDTYRGATA